MIFSWTGNLNIEQGTITETQVTTVDIHATILAITTSGQTRTESEGANLLPAMCGKGFQSRPLFWHFPHCRSNHRDQTFMSAVRRGRWKLLFHYGHRTYELYDTIDDIGESTNQIHERPDVAHNLSLVLRDWLVAVDAQ